MSEKSINELLSENFEPELVIEAINFPSNKFNIITLKENPIKIRCVILDNDREFHLIIDELRSEIFHDCPTFLIHSEKKEKICIHIIKIFTMIEESIAIKILSSLETFVLTSIGSKKKSKNFLKLANRCFESNNSIEGLSYLNKAIINQQDCEPIIERYLQTALDNNLLIEIFEFLKSAYENELYEYLVPFKSYIEKAHISFLNSVKDYTFFNVLRTMGFIDFILDKFDIEQFNSFPAIIHKLLKMTKSDSYNERYFSFFFIKKYNEILIKHDDNFKDIILSSSFNDFLEETIDYFLGEIESFSIIDKLKLMKSHFDIFGISRKKYYARYKKYKEEIREIEKKVYLKKFAFLKLLIEKHNVLRSKGDFRKKRSTYIINHKEENAENPAYRYIIEHVGFFGINNSTIKSSEIGVNYLIINDLFLDDFTNFPDIFYFRKQFWEDWDDYEINIQDGFSLLIQPFEHNYDIDQQYTDINDLLIVEWDLANKPRQGSLVNAYGSQIIIPDQNSPLYHDLKPFDLCYCQKTPVKMEGNIIKTINVITKCSFKDAITSVFKGMEFIEGYYPLSLIKSIVDRSINPFKAYELVKNNPNKSFVPNYRQFLEAFREFLFHFINNERDYIFDILKDNPEENSEQLITLLNLNTELAGINLPYHITMKNLIIDEINFHEFRSQFLQMVHLQINEILKTKQLGSTRVFDLKKMQHTQFYKYSQAINDLRREEFEQRIVYKSYDQDKPIYDISQLSETFYGEKLMNILNLKDRKCLSGDQFNKFRSYTSKMNLKLKIEKV